MQLKEFIVNHFWWKLSSFVAATILWITLNDFIKYSPEASAKTLLPVPVRPEEPFDTYFLSIGVITHAEEDRRYILEPPQVEITLQAPAARLLEVESQDILIYVDSRDIDGLENGVMLKVHVIPPDETRVAKLFPDRIILNILPDAPGPTQSP